MMEIVIIVLLVLAAIALLLVELFLIPGISLAGIAAGCCIVYANYYAFSNLGQTGGWITLAVSALTTILSVVLFMRSKTPDKIALQSEIDSTVDRSAEQRIKVGDEGVSTTRLALIGYAEIHGEIVEVKSTGEFLNEKTPIRVCRIQGSVILVERKAD